MKVVYDSILKEEEKGYVNYLAKKCGILFDTARLLYCRKIDSPEKIDKFLHPSKNNFIDPFNLNGMREAVDRIAMAKAKKENVLVFGDYDVDGISACTILVNCLKEYGIEASSIVPEREDGYGISVEKILSTSSNVNLVITVDCGISDIDKIEELKNKGIDVVVTDHHEPPEILPNCIVINPKISGQKYAFSGLCGAGVAYKLGFALIGEKANSYLDYVALATVSDSMELVEENRDIVFEGLKLFNSKDIRPVFKFLMGENNRQITAHSFSFSIAPKINAGGRMGNANLVLKLFLSNKISEISEYTEKLKAYNVNRQVECDEIFRIAKSQVLNSSLIDDSIIMIYNENWRTGFTGIIAARLVEEFSRPVIAFAEKSGGLKGSARSVDGINIHQVISSASDILLTFGGHSQAAGVSVLKENFEKLRIRLNDYVKNNFKGVDFSKTVHAEWEVKEPLSARFVKEINMLEPFGIGNKTPLFATRVNEIIAKPFKSGSPHYMFNTDVIEMIDFNGERDMETLSLPVDKMVVFETNVSVYKNKESSKGFVKYIVPFTNDLSNLKYYIVENELEKCKKQADISVKDIKDFTTDGVEKVLYVISDIDNIERFNQVKTLPVGLFETEKGVFGSSVVISLKEDIDGFKKIVYLDNPLSFLKSNSESYCNFDILGYNYIKEIKTDRETMAEVYKKLCANVGKEYYNLVSFVKSINEEDTLTYIFGLKVFMELGIFSVKENKFCLDKNVKSQLTNSKIYNRVISIKG